MLSRLITSVLLFAVLAALACWNTEGRPACDESRPVFGAGACCDGHRVAGTSAVALESVTLEAVALEGAPREF